jgi:hypothetical protein
MQTRDNKIHRTRQGKPPHLSRRAHQRLLGFRQRRLGFRRLQPPPLRAALRRLLRERAHAAARRHGV